MAKLALLSPKELVKILERLGFEQTRQKGSHVRFVHPDGRKTTVPFHASREIGPGLLNKIISSFPAKGAFLLFSSFISRFSSRHSSACFK